MARKKIEPIIGLGNEDKLTVQKSLPLFSLWRSDLSLAEFKILDTYLARIDSHKSEKRTVTFSKGELEEKLGVQRIRTEELDERLKHLGTPIRIDDTTSKNKKFTRISLFEKAIAEQDENGLWKVELTASQSAMKYFFNVENLGYLRYKLRCVTSLTSRYTYIMFCYLEKNRFRKSWEVSLAELKKILNCDKEELYKEFKFFNQKILKRVQTEMHEKTECRYSYEPIKKGRSVVAVRFTVETLSDEIDVNQLTLDQIDEEEQRIEQEQAAIQERKHKERLDFLNEATGKIFTTEQMEVISLLLADNPNVPSISHGDKSVELARYNYLARLVAKMNETESRTGKKIKDKFAYITAILRKESEK